jgi:uncharacterized membrane protein YfcA
MEIVIITIAAFLVAILTFFSGFGLGTILTPVFMLFFPVELAVALTGIVHFCNNLFKLFLVGAKADKNVLLRFGLPAVLAAFAGAWLLLQIKDLQPLFSYRIGSNLIDVYPVKFIVSLLLLSFAIIELLPYFKHLQFNKNKLPVGGILSGFFGGLSGNQGALRSAFLIKAGLSKETFIGTAVVVSTFVDFTRLSVYASRFNKVEIEENIVLIICAVAGGITGSYIGLKLLKKVTLEIIQKSVAVLLIVLSIALGAGFI